MGLLLVRAGLLATISVAGAATDDPGLPQPPWAGDNDWFRGTGCNCSSFCAGSCAINGSEPLNLTFYRMTMSSVLGLANKDTGDAPGDTSFLLKTRAYALRCRQDPSAMECRQAQFAGDRASSTDRIAAFDVEVDGQWGPYLQCNPHNNTAPGASSSAWGCKYYEQPQDWPAVCGATAVEGHNNVAFDDEALAPVRRLANSSLAGCCKSMHEESPHRVSAFAYHRAERSCWLYRINQV
jgi:hypothetical protein